MARPIKSGLDYFPLNVDFFEDDKTELISAEYGSKGVEVILRLLAMIYKNGYYYEWNEEKALLLAKRIGNGVTGDLASRIVARSIERSFFHESVFDQFGILTSEAIQNNYLSAVSRRVEVEMVQEYCLICHANFENVIINSINADRNAVNTDSNTQSKEKKSKVKESKVKESKVINTDYKAIFEHYISKDNLVKHRTFTNAMKQSLDKAFKAIKLTKADALVIIDRHSKIVELTKEDTQYMVRPRPFYELFGQKAFKADHLICAEYLDDGSKYMNYLSDQAVNRNKSVESSTKGQSKAAEKRNAQIIQRDKKYTEEELEEMLLNKNRNRSLDANI